MTQVEAIGCFLLGSLALVNWWFEMFSDSFFGQVARATGKYFNRRKNSASLFFPSTGLAFLTASFLMIAIETGASDNIVLPLGYLAIFFLVVAVLGLFPFPLPKWMYPEYHFEKRQKAREELLTQGHTIEQKTGRHWESLYEFRGSRTETMPPYDDQPQ